MPLFLKDIITAYRIEMVRGFWFFFSFNASKILLHCLFACIVLQEVVCHPYLCSLYITCLFSLPSASFKIFFLSLILNNFIIMCLDIVFFLFLWVIGFVEPLCVYIWSKLKHFWQLFPQKNFVPLCLSSSVGLLLVYWSA